MYAVRQYHEHEMNIGQYLKIMRLENTIWPHPKKSVAELAEEALVFSRQQSDNWVRRYVVWEAGDAIAHARIFPRKIITPESELKIMALAGVCVNQKIQGKGLGKSLMESVFHDITLSPFPISLFQTDVPGFYEKLGAKIVSNPFINSQKIAEPDANPWWGEYVMVYPDLANFPEGEIDLNGPGY